MARAQAHQVCALALLPAQEYLTRTGRTFDGPGIPPDLRTPVFTDDELDHGRDSALARARALPAP